MGVHPVVSDGAVVVDAVAQSLGRPLQLDSELDPDVYRLHRTAPGPDLVARAFGPAVERARHQRRLLT